MTIAECKHPSPQRPPLQPMEIETRPPTPRPVAIPPPPGLSEKEIRFSIDGYIAHAQQLSSRIDLGLVEVPYPQIISIAFQALASLEKTRPLSKQLDTSKPKNIIVQAKIELAFAIVSLTFNRLGGILKHTKSCGACSAIYHADQGWGLLKLATKLGATFIQVHPSEQLAAHIYAKAHSIRTEKTPVNTNNTTITAHSCAIANKVKWF